MSKATLRALFLIGILSAFAACRSAPPLSVSLPALPPVIDEPVAAGPRVVPNDERFARDTRVQWPAFDGDPFWVSLPDTGDTAATPDEIRKRYVTPLLEALGVQPDQVSLVDPAAGIPQPAGSPEALVRLAAARAARAPALTRPDTRRVVAALLGADDAEADAMFARAEGRTRADALADLGRRDVMYPYLQVVKGVPIEYTGVFVSRQEGRSVYAMRGALLVQPTVVNAPTVKPTDAVRAAIEAVARQAGVSAVVENARAARPAHVLLPYGRDEHGRARLRHSYRVHLTGKFDDITAPFIAWVDADDLTLLKLRPVLNPVAANGLMWARDPRDTAEPTSFNIDTASAVDGYTLTRSGLFHRLDFRGDDVYTSDEVSVPGTGPPSFDVAPANDPVAARCGANKKFQQVHVFATLSRLHDEVLAQGIFTPYPQYGGFTVTVEQKRPGAMSTLPRCSSWAGITMIQLGACEGYTSPQCPDAAVSDLLAAQLNHAHDVTIVAHEFGHTITEQLTTDRPPDWCGTAVCPYRGGLRAVHELADFWAAHFTWTNCIGGWVGKNVTGLNRGLDCDPWHHPDYGLPRKLSLPEDRFPEVRTAQCGEYCDGQTAGAALWEARVGARSRSPLLGVPEFGVRLQAALRNLVVSADLNNAASSGVKVYRLHQGVLRELAAEYASGSSASLAHDVLSGFARAGIFLAPYECVTLTAAAAPPTCRAGSPADAVIDVDDRDRTNDPVIAGVRYRQGDYLSPASKMPTFQVWTGPRYRLDHATGAVVTSGTARCHKEFIVDVSTHPEFPARTTVSSGWKKVSRRSSNRNACHGVWTPAASRFTALQVGTKIYYRARTRKAPGGAELVSTQPGAGLIGDIPAPFLLVTADGLPEF